MTTKRVPVEIAVSSKKGHQIIVVRTNDDKLFIINSIDTKFLGEWCELPELPQPQIERFM